MKGTKRIEDSIYFYFFIYCFFREGEAGAGEGGREREKLWFVVPLIYAFIGCFLYEACPEKVQPLLI